VGTKMQRRTRQRGEAGEDEVGFHLTRKSVGRLAPPVRAWPARTPEFFLKKGETITCFQRLIFRTKNRLMNTKRILISAVTGLILTGSLAFAAQGNDQGRSKTRVRAAKSTATMTTSGNTRAVRTRQIANNGNMRSVRTGRVTTSGNTAIRTSSFSGGSTVFVGSSFGSPYYYGYG